MKLNKNILNKNYTLASWFFTKNVITSISKILGVGIKQVSVVSGFDIVIEVVNKNIYPVLLFLSNHTLWQFKNKKTVRKVLSSFKFYEEALDTGKIISVKDGVARVNGLFGVLSGEMVHLGLSKIQGMVLSLEHNTPSVVIHNSDLLYLAVNLMIVSYTVLFFFFWSSSLLKKSRSNWQYSNCFGTIDLKSCFTKGFFFSVQGTLIKLLSRILLILILLIGFFFFFSVPGIGFLLLIRSILKLFMVTLVLFYLLKHHKLVHLIVVSKGRDSYLKRLVLPLGRERYVELGKSLKHILVLFIINGALIVYSFKNFYILTFFVTFLLMISVKYVLWAGKIITDYLSGIQFITITSGRIIPNVTEKSLVLYKRSDYLIIPQKKFLLLRSYNNLIVKNAAKSLVLYKRSDYLVGPFRNRLFHTGAILRMPLGEPWEGNGVYSSILMKPPENRVSTVTEAATALRAIQLDNVDVTSGWVSYLCFGSSVEGPLLEEFMNQLAPNEYTTHYLSVGGRLALNNELNALRYELDGLNKHESSSHRYSYLKRRIARIEQGFEWSNSNFAKFLKKTPDISKCGNLKAFGETGFDPQARDQFLKVGKENAIVLRLFKAGMNTGKVVKLMLDMSKHI